MESVRFCLPRGLQDPPTESSDIFALGSLIYFFMTGRQPFHALSEYEVTSRYTQGDFPDVTSIASGEIIRGCWKGQYRSAIDVWRNLQELDTPKKSEADMR